MGREYNTFRLRLVGCDPLVPPSPGCSDSCGSPDGGERIRYFVPYVTCVAFHFPEHYAPFSRRMQTLKFIDTTGSDAGRTVPHQGKPQADTYPI
eukprot:1191506-Prymnesium_polylepis.1